MTSPAHQEPHGEVVGPYDETLLCYRTLLHRFHRALDLMSDAALADLPRLIRDADAYGTAVRELVPPGLVLDLGTGAGLPAAVIAARDVLRPMAWVERRSRRTSFLRIVASHCRFDAVRVHGADVRALAPRTLGGRVAAVTAQAVGGWSDLYAATAHLHDDVVTLVVRRGAPWRDEIEGFAARLPGPVHLLRAHDLEGGGTLVALQAPGGLTCR